MNKNENNCGIHDPEIESRLRLSAGKYVDIIKENPETIAVMLAGSVARGGPVTAASDLDLYVFSTTLSSSKWVFSKDETLKDFHCYDLNCINKAIKSSTNTSDLAQWFHDTQLGDLLDRAEVLYWNNNYTEELSLFFEILKKRHDGIVKIKLVNQYLTDCINCLRKSRQALESGAYYTAHQILRWSVQDLLISQLISLGWTIKGAKKRPEIASQYSNSPFMIDVMGLFNTIMGLDKFNSICATQMTLERLEIRYLFHNDLLKAKSNNDLPEKIRASINDFYLLQTEHDNNSFNYYLPLISGGGYMGAVNHIRAISGFSYIPFNVMSRLEHECDYSIEKFFASVHISDEFKIKWLNIAGLECESSKIEIMITEFEGIIYRMNTVSQL